MGPSVLEPICGSTERLSAARNDILADEDNEAIGRTVVDDPDLEPLEVVDDAAGGGQREGEADERQRRIASEATSPWGASYVA